MTGKVGVVGLGNMGGPMARNLLKAGVKLVVHDRRGRRQEEGSAVVKVYERLTGVKVAND